MEKQPWLRGSILAPGTQASRHPAVHPSPSSAFMSSHSSVASTTPSPQLSFCHREARRSQSASRRSEHDELASVPDAVTTRQGSVAGSPGSPASHGMGLTRGAPFSEPKVPSAAARPAT
jgi:hypothetical protein